MPKKKVDVLPQGKPITAMNIMIRSDITGATLDVKDIREIILQKGRVREIFPDGSKYDLNLSNYDNMNLYEKVKANRIDEEAKKKQAEIERAKQEAEIAQKREARKAAIQNSKTAVATATVAKAAEAPKAATSNTAPVSKVETKPNAVDEARAKIEANKAKTPVQTVEEKKN